MEMQCSIIYSSSPSNLFFTSVANPLYVPNIARIRIFLLIPTREHLYNTRVLIRRGIQTVSVPKESFSYEKAILDLTEGDSR